MRALFGERGVVFFSLLGRSKLCIHCGVRDVGDVAVFGEIVRLGKCRVDSLKGGLEGGFALFGASSVYSGGAVGVKWSNKFSLMTVEI